MFEIDKEPCGPRARGEDPLRTTNNENLRKEEALILDVVLHLATHGHKAVGTIKHHLIASKLTVAQAQNA